MIMKLFILEINNGWDCTPDYEEKHKLVAAENISAASIKAVEFMNKEYETDQYAIPGFHVSEISNVDGYEIKLIKSEYYAKT